MKFKLNILIFIIAFGFLGKSKAQTWDTLPDLYYTIPKQIIEYNGTLIFAGGFIFNGCDPYDDACQHKVIGWDTISYTLYPGNITQGTSHSACVFNGNLILGGNFDEDIENLAIWNGTSWEQLGSLQWHHQMEVRFLTEYQDSLYIGGPGVYCPEQPELVNLITWNGTSFSGTTFSDESRALCVYDNKLYSGMFSTFQLPNGEWLHGVAAYENG
ncbi:MAG: hypothetical protein R6V52_06780, partial [Bacteroidales bacterium]